MAESDDDVFRALADPTRRRILDVIAERGPVAVGEIAAEFPELVSSGISKHLMGLRAAGLVSATKQGRHQLYRLDGDRLRGTLEPWLRHYERHWSGALDRLRDLAELEARATVQDSSSEPAAPSPPAPPTPGPRGRFVRATMHA